MDETKNKTLPFASGLVVGTAVAAAATFLYKTKSGKKVKKVLSGYYNVAKEHLDEVIKEVAQEPQVKKIEKEVKKEAKIVNKKVKAVKKKVFRKSGHPLVK